jgi:hypothetical protein
MTKYRVIPFSDGGFSNFPPKWVEFVFPLYNGELIEYNEGELIFTFEEDTQVSLVAGFIVQKFDEQTKTWQNISQ